MPQRRTGDRPALTRDAIVEAAEHLADSGGLDAVTLRAVAAVFQTGQASLYRHIAGRDDLLSLLAERLATGYPTVTDDADDPTNTVLRQWGALHDHLAARPWAAPLIADGTHLAHGAERMSRALTGQLRRAGVGEADVSRAYRAAWHLLLGHLLTDHPFGHTDRGVAEAGASHTDAADTAAPSDGIDHLTAPGSGAATTPTAPADGEFLWAFRRLLAGTTAYATTAATTAATA